MTHRLLPLTLVLTLCAAPVAAQDSDAEPPGLIARGVDLFLRQFFEDAGPQMRDLSGALDRMAPALRDLSVLVDDIRNYEAPVRQDNGDIVIRRREGAPPPPPIGEGLRDLSPPDPQAPWADPDAPQIAL